MPRNPDKKKSIGFMKSEDKRYRFVTQRPVAVLMTTLAVIVFGYVSYSTLSLNLMPDITYPTLTIRTEFEGAAPEEVENLISRSLEQILAVVRNKTGLSSISRAGQSDIILEFTWDTNMNTATQDVRELLEQFIPPDGAKKPLVLRYDPTLDPILRLGMYSEKTDTGQTLYTLREIAEEEIKRDLEAIPGVAAVKVKGGLEEEIVIDLDEKQLTTLGLNINDINMRLAAENVNLAGGNLEEGDTEFLVRTLNLFLSIKEIEDLIIYRRQGAEVRLKDIGEVYRSHKEREVITRVNGKESVELEVYKEADANIVQLATAVKQRVFGTPKQQEDFNRWQSEQKNKPSANNERTKRNPIIKPNYVTANLPSNVKIALLSDQSSFIEKSIAEVRQTAVLGGIFAIMVLFFFLRNGYSTFIIALSIPISIIATFAPMNIFSVTLNMMSLGGLALGIGMLVDNSIVVLESIFRCREEGDKVEAAAVRGASEVGGAVTASTLTTTAVFLPIVFVEGVAGQLFGDLSLTVVFSLFMSLVVALFFIPMMASRNFKSLGERTSAKSNLFKPATEKWLGNILRRMNWIDVTTVDRGKKTERNLLRSIPQSLLYFTASLSLFIEGFIKLTLAFMAEAGTFIKAVLILLLSPIHALVTLAVAIIKPSKIKNLYTTKFAMGEEIVRGKPAFLQKLKTLVRFDYVWQGILSFDSYSLFAESAAHISKKHILEKLQKIKTRPRKNILLSLLSVLFLPVSIIFALLSLMGLFVIQIILKTVSHLLLKVLNLFVITSMAIIITYLIKILTYLLRGTLGPMLILFDMAFESIRKAYPRILLKSLDNRKALLGTASVVFLATIFLILPQVGTELIPELHQGEFNVDLRMPIGTPLEITDESAIPVDEHISTLNGIEMRAAVIGAEKKSTKSSDEGEHTSKITIRLTPSKEGIITSEENLIAKIRQFTSDLPQIETKISRPVLFSFKTPIEVEIKGYNLEQLKEIANRVVHKMEQVEGIYDVRSSLQSGNPEIHIIYNRERLAKYSLNLSNVAQIVRNKVLGYVPTNFNKEDRKIEIRVKVRESDRNTLLELSQLNVAPTATVPIPLSAVAELKQEEGPSEIRRIEQQRAALVTANVSGLDLGSAARNILNELNNIEIPPDFGIDISGQNKEMEVSMRSLTMAMILAIFLVYTVMAMLFESFIQPLIIILTIPLALIGVLLVLWIGNIPISVVVGIGVIVLVGIVVNNAIVLVDYTNTLRQRGLSLREAITQAGTVRLRPILMTTTTTVLGLLPMALGLGEGAEIRTPMAWTIIAGLISSTILTLLVIPAVYNIIADLTEKRKTLRMGD